MDLNRIVKYSGMLLLWVGVGCSTASTKKEQATRYLNDVSNGLLQKQKLERGEITVQLIPEDFLFTNETTQAKGTVKSNNARWAVKTTLTLPAGKLPREMSNHLNISIKESFRMIAGTDTVPCLMCDRIPGIRPNEYNYLMSFGTLGDQNRSRNDWRLQVNDPVMGLANLEFVFKKEKIDQFIAITN
jgi:hypothetical protein